MNDFIFESRRGMDSDIIDKCANCCSNLLLHEGSENEGISKLRIKSNLSSGFLEIQIWNALEFIYGVSWKSIKNKLELEKKSSLLNRQGEITFCHNCASLLTKNYNCHQKFEDTCHSDSLVKWMKVLQQNTNSLALKILNDTHSSHEEDRDEKGTLFDDFIFDEADDPNEFQDSIETKYQLEPLPIFSDSTKNLDDTTSSIQSEKLTVPSRGESLGSHQLRIKVEKLSDEEIFQFTNKRETKKNQSRFRNVSAVKKRVGKIHTTGSYDKNDLSWKGDVSKRMQKSARKTSEVQTRSSKELNNQNHVTEAAENGMKTEELKARQESSKNIQSSSAKIKKRKKAQNDNKSRFHERVEAALLKVQDKTQFQLLIVSGRYICVACGKDFSSKHKDSRAFRHHWNVHHEGSREMCDICGKLLTSLWNIKWHKLRRHGTEEEKNKWRTTCNKCGAVVFSFALTAHLSAAHPEGPRVKYKCDQCGAEYASKHYLADHYAVHKEGPQQCDICFKTFNSRQNLQQHKKIHSNRQKTIPCDKCSMKFYTVNGLTKHSICHEESRNYVCHQCGKTFKHKCHFNLHIKCHKDIDEKGEDSFTCELCGKHFKHSLSLRKHKINLHTSNAKIHQCSFCGKRLCSNYNLIIHEKMHKESPGFKPRVRQKLPGHMIFSTSVNETTSTELTTQDTSFSETPVNNTEHH